MITVKTVNVVYSFLSRLIKNDCPAFDLQYYDTRISLNESLKACSETMMFLLAVNSPPLDSTMPSAMVGHTVTSAKHYKLQTCELPSTFFQIRNALYLISYMNLV